MIRLLIALLRRLERRQWRKDSRDAMTRRAVYNGFDLERGTYRRYEESGHA